MVGHCRNAIQKGAPVTRFLLVFLGATGCAASQREPTTPERVVEMEELRITARRGAAGYEFDAYDAPELFKRATELLNQQQCREAAGLYDQVAAEFESSRYASAALYNAGLCLQALADFAAAAERYAAVRDKYPDSDDVKDASFQLAEVLVQLERWEEVLAVSDALLAREDLPSDERLEAMARRAQGLLGAGKLEETEQYVRGALSYFRTREGDQKVADEFFAAALTYVLAESYRLAGQQMAFPPDTEGQKQALLARAQLLLEAQREYFNTIQFQNLDNLHWAAASGYRIGAMYDELWHAVTNAPVPPEVAPEGHAVYREELQKFVKPLIRHAIRYWELTQMMIERTGIRTQWAEKTKADLARVRALMLEQPPGPSGLDYAREKQSDGAGVEGEPKAAPDAKVTPAISSDPSPTE